MDNRGGKASLNSLSVNGASLDNTSGALFVRGDLAASTNSFINTQGKVVVGGRLDGVHGVLSNSQGLLQAGLLALDVDGQFDNERGTVRQTGGATANLNISGELRQGGGMLDIASGLVLNTAALSGTGGVLNINGDLVLNSGATSAHGGKWAIGANARLSTGDLDSRDGSIAVGGTLALSAASIDNAGGKILSEGDTSIAASETLGNSAGQIRSGGDLGVTAGEMLTNDAGKIESTGSAAELHVGAAAIANGSGHIVNAGSGATLLTAGVLTSRGVVGGNGVLEISADRLVNEEQGRIVAVGDLNLRVGANLANTGSIASGGKLAMMQQSAHVFNQGNMISQGDLSIASSAIDNTGGTIATATGSGSALLLQTGSLRNDGGTLQSDASARLDVVGIVSNQGGRVQSGQDLALAIGGSLANRDGAIEASGKLDLRASDVGNKGGSILGVGAGQTVLNIANGIDSDGQIGANGDLRILAGTLDNGAAGSISTTGKLVFDVRDSVTNRGVISSAGTLDFDKDQASLANSGTITSGEAMQVKLDLVDNEGGTIETRNGAEMTLTANALHNRNGHVAASGAARITIGTVLDNTAEGLRASGALDVSAGRALQNHGGSIELGGAQATLAVQAASIDSTAGRIVNVGTGSTTLTAEAQIDVSGLVAGNGGLRLSARTLNNAGIVSAADSLELAVSEVIENAGTLSAATRLHVQNTDVILRNSGTIVAGSLVDINAGTIDNADGRIATAAGSGADISLNANALDNRGGEIMADRDATLQVRNAADNAGGVVQANSTLRLTSGGVLENTGGVIETLAEESTLAVDVEALRNAGGRVVNAGRGDTTLIATSVDNGGVIGGHGRLVLEADTATNTAGGTITSGAELRLQVREHLDNAGSISSSGTLAMDESGARLTNSGSIVSGADASIRAGTIENDGGTIATASRSGASISLRGAYLSNRDGRIVADDAMLLVFDGPLDNTGGAIQGVSSVQVDSGAALDNDSGLIEATGAQATLAVSAETVVNGTGRIVNVGEGAASVSATTGIANSGLIAGNGRLNLAGATLENAAGGTIAAADAMTVAIHDVLQNRGTFTSGSSLDLAVADAAVRNSGLIVAGGPLTLRARELDNDEGQLASASGSGADLDIAAGAVSNRAGVIQASGDLALTSGSSVNNFHGTLQGASSLALHAVGDVANDGGVIESLEAEGTLQLQAAALDNGGGRIVNVGKGATGVALTGTLASNGLIAGNGTLAVSAAEVDNRAAGMLASGGTMTLAAVDRIANAGAISSGAALSLGAVTLRNSGRVTGTGDIVVNATALDNSSGQLATVNDSGGAIVVQAATLANLGGTILADGAVRLSTSGALANGGGTIRAGESMLIDAGGSLGNQGGSIEAAASDATLALTAQAIDNRGGRLVNAGTGDTRIRSATEVLNSGTLAGNGRFELDAAALGNLSEGSLAAGGPMELRVTQQFINAGAISSAGAFTLDQAGTSIANSGDITAAGRITLHGSSIDNDGGEIATQSGADIVLDSRSSLSNNGGIVAATGNAVLNAQGTVDNGDGLVQTGGHLALTTAGALTNAGGRVEAVGPTSTLELAAESIDNGGRIVNAGTGTTSIEAVNAIANGGTIAGSGAFDLQATAVHNAASGSIVSGGPLVMALRETLDNHGGTISSTGTLRFDGLGASFTNSGRIGAGGLMDIAASNINNDGGRIYTANVSGAAITLQAGDLSNLGGTIAADGSFALRTSGDISNDGGTLHGGRNFTLDAGGRFDNRTGVVESGAGSLNVRAQSIVSGGRIVNAGVGATTLSITGDIINRGTIAGNGTLTVQAASLQNWTGAQLASGGDLQLEVRQQLSNAGSVTSGGTLSFEQLGATLANSGEIASAGNASFRLASFNNDSGTISTVKGSGAAVAVTSSSLGNRNGKILADGRASFELEGDADNSGGILQAGRDLVFNAAGSLANNGGTIEALGADSAVTIDSAAIDNTGGRISNAGSGDMRLSASTGMTNGGTIAAMGDLALAGQHLLNGAAGMIASGGNLDVAITRQWINQGKVNGGGTLTFDQAGASFANSGVVIAGAHAYINVAQLNNDGGRLGTGDGSGADLTLHTQELSNAGGRIATDRDLTIVTAGMTGSGELYGGRDLSLAMQGDYVQSTGGQLRSNRDLSLAVTGNITNASVFEAARNLNLSGQHFANQEGATIEAQSVTLQAVGNLVNAGEVNAAAALDIRAAHVTNTSGIVGGDVIVNAKNLDNSGGAALIGATGNLELGVAGTLNNVGGATLYSSGELYIGGVGGGSTSLVNNISSTIEAGANLALDAVTLTNERENVQITKVKTLDETRRMNMPSWYQFGDNHNYYETSAANYSPYEIYFVNPADILEETPYVTPDGYTIVRAVIRTHANDSAYFLAHSGLYNAYGTQQRMATADGTRVIYYTQREQMANPDQGGPAGNALLPRFVTDVKNWTGTVAFSNQYGSCSTDCIRLVAQPGYTDPATTILRDTQKSLAPRKDALELWRDAHHTVVEDQIVPGAGAASQILSGGDMYLSVSDALLNRYGTIKARGRLTIEDESVVTNVGATLYRTHTFDGVWRSYGGTTTAYSHPSISEVIGTTRGVIEGEQGLSISARSFNNIDVTAGTVGNIRDRVEVIGSGASGAASSGIQATVGSGSAGTLEGSAGASGWGSNAALAAVESVSGANNSAGSVRVAGSGIANVHQSGDAAVGGGQRDEFATIAGAAASGINNQLVTNGGANLSSHAFQDSLTPAAAALLGRVVTGNVRSAAGAVIAQEVTQVRGETLGKVMTVAPSGLFVRNPDANGSYLFETRPQFANQQQWISSAYLLEQLSIHPATMQKRLGDGFYEQRLVREQLAELTGHTTRSGASDDSVYRDLLTNAVSFAREFNLRPGIALTAEQISHLTSDIVWLENQTVQLPDGSVDTVLVPKVYLAHVGKQALQTGGALVTGANVTIRTTENIVNRGGVIDGGNGRTLLVAGQDVVNQGGKIAGGLVGLAAVRDVHNETLAAKESFATDHNRGSYTSVSNRAEILAAGALDIQAGRDLVDLAGTIKAGTADITAGRDVNFGTVRTGSTYEHLVGGYTQNDSSTAHQLSQLSTGGDLNIRAGGNLSMTGTQVAIGTSGAGNGKLLAGGSVNIHSVTNEVNTSLQNDSSSKNYDKQVHRNETVIGANVTSSGKLVVGAGVAGQGSVNVVASGLNAGDALRVFATDNVNIVAAQEKHLSDTASTHSSSSLLRSKTTEQSDYVASSIAVGSALSGKTVELKAGKDINVLGSSIAGEGDVDLAASGNVSIGAATSTVTEKHRTKVKESGFLSGGGFGISYGTRTTTTDHNRDATTQSGQSRSMVGSIGGDLSVSAGEALKISGSDLSAGQDMSLSGKSVAITAGTDDVNDKFTTKTTQTGLTLAVGGSVVNAIQTAQGMSAAASQTSNGRMKALAAAAAAMTAKDAAQDLAKNGPSVRISATVGRSESESTEVSASRTHGGSVLAAGNNVTISATGGGKASNIDIIGSDVRATGNVSLLADNQVNLLAAQDTESQHSQSKSSSAAVGVAAEFSTSGGPRIGITASASASRSRIDGEGTTQVNSHVDAGNRLTIVSGGDTNLKGAVANGKQVIAEVGGNLNIESLQDTAKLDGKQESFSVSGTFGVGMSGASASASRSKVHNDYASVQEQTAIRAGDGGFQIQVGGNTDLKGAVITSSEQAVSDGRNSLATTTLSFSDIQNRDSHNASGISLGVNIGISPKGDPSAPSIAPGIGKVSGSQSSVTPSGVSQGALTVVDAQGEQAVASLDRNVITGRDTSEALTKGWNGAQALAEVSAQMQITSAAMPRLAKEIGDFAATRMAELNKQGNTEEAAKWAEGGIYRVAAHAALGALGGGLNGAIGAAAAAEAAPSIDELQKAMTAKLTGAGLGENTAEFAAKLIAGGAAGIIGGMAGSSGAATGLNADANNRQLHPDETTWIKKNAARFAAEKGISVDEATRRLAHQASRDVDLVWRGVLSDTVDKEAQSFLTQAQGQTFTNGFGQKQALFTTQDRQFTAVQDGLFEVDKSFVNKYVTPYATRKALDGVWTEIGQSATNIVDTVRRDPVGVMVQTGRSLADSAWDAVWHPKDTANDLIKSAKSDAKTFGEGVAASTNKYIQRQLNSLYGQDVTSAVQIATSAQGAVMLGSALGAGKAGSKVTAAFDSAVGLAKKIEKTGPNLNATAKANVSGHASYSQVGLDSSSETNIHANVAASSNGNASSNFSEFARREALVKEALAANQSPWPLGYTPVTRPMGVGEQFNMVIDANQAKGLSGPGGWATFSPIPNQVFARETLAITEQFKPDVSFVQRFEVIQNFNAQTGPIGPQIDQVTGRLLEGSQTVFQLDLQLPWSDRVKFIKPVGKPDPIH
ncbi:MAG TPA: hypothetical protein DCX52_14520 [Massilia sp.]|nr:hypothetical protein [Massilia sp.]